MSRIEQFQLKDGVEYIKIHGLQRTGTNYLTFLFDNNLEGAKCVVNAGGWKHGYYCAPWCLGREVHVAVLKKDPYSWLVSMYNYWGPRKTQPVGPNLENVSFAEFVRGRAVFEEKAGSPFLYLAANPVQHWNSLYYHWSSIRMNTKKLAIIPFEALLERPEYVIDAVAKHFNVKRKQGPISNAEGVVVPSDETAAVSDVPFDKGYYAERRYMAYYSKELVEFVNSQLDQEVMMSLGYEYVKP